MTIESQIASTPNGALIAGLVWRPAPGDKPSTAALTEAKELHGGTHYVRMQAGKEAVYGLFQLRVHEEGTKLPKGALSAAALFAQRVGQDVPDAALVVRVPSTAEHPEADRLYLVILEVGLPFIDKTCTEDEALRLLGPGPRRVWSDWSARFADAEEGSLAWLGELPAKSPTVRLARIRAIPLNPWPIVMATLVASSIGVGWFLWARHEDQERRSRAARAQAAADPKPRYLAALSREQHTMATQRAAMVSVAERLFELPVYVPGWQLRGAECSARAGACTANWARRGGAYDELRFALPQHKLILSEEVPPTLDLAVTSWSINVPRAPLPGKAPLFQAAVVDGGTLFQQWKTASIVIAMARPVLWPVVPDLPGNFDHPQLVKRGEITAKEVPGPFVLEALREAPAWVSWETVKVDIGDLSLNSPRTVLAFTLTGDYYVSAH